ncbi:glycosyltransferase family 2 protein [Haladaptatus sp. CMSO5]|uniref:glycosyltransferase family 2 protein n=1 Tax=Haladaptatus sp. CMSO5 TaxID=3120514 RepID=UPI002FCE5E4C
MVQVTVVLPTYNSASFLPDALESLSAQTFEDFEVLIVDDQSTDGTQEIAKNWSDSRMRLVVREERGLPSALNRGIAEARGKYIARHDADDFSEPARLARQYQFLERHPAVSLVGSGTHIVTEDGTRRSTRHVVEWPSFNELLSGNQFVHGSVMMRREAVIDVSGYDESLTYTEDYDLWLRLASKYVVSNIDEPLYNLRLLSDSIYSEKLRSVKLFGRYARLRIQGRASPQLQQEVEAGNVEAVYDQLTDEQRADFHKEMAIELLRYGQLQRGREESRISLEYEKSVIGILILCLSRTNETIVSAVVLVYRAVLNLNIYRANRRER